METLTLARYILEMSLMEYEFVSLRESEVAAASLWLALKMKKAGDWVTLSIKMILKMIIRQPLKIFVCSNTSTVMAVS